MKSLTSPLTLIAACAALTACNLHVTPPPPDCSPLDVVNKATPPAPTGGSYPESINIVDQDEKDGVGYSWAHGQGYVLAPLAAVWAALQMPAVVADRRQLKSDGWVILQSNVDPKADWSFNLQCTTSPSTGLTFPYNVAWRGAHTAGTATVPTAAAVCGDLTQSGTFAGANLMSILSDSIVLTAVSEGVTQYSVIRHRGPLSDSGANCKQYVLDVYNSVVAQVHGMALPPNQN